MATWSGLFDGTSDVDSNGPPYKMVSAKPRGEYLRCLFQRRGLYGYSKEIGSDTPATVKGVDHVTASATPGPAQNSMLIPGTATDGRSPPTRDIEILAAYGSDMPLEDRATPAEVSAGELSSVSDVRRNYAYPADLSGNGGVALTPSNPAGHPPTPGPDLPA